MRIPYSEEERFALCVWLGTFNTIEEAEAVRDNWLATNE